MENRKTLRGYLREHALSISLAFTASILLGLVSSILFSMVGPAIEILTKVKSTEPISTGDLLGERAAYVLAMFDLNWLVPAEVWQALGMMILAFALFRAILTQLQWVIWENIGESIAAKMRRHLIQSFLGQSYQSTNHRSIFNELSGLITNDTRMAREYIVHFYGGLPREIIQIAFYMGMLVILSPSLFAIFVFGLLPAAFMLTKLGRRLRKRANEALIHHASLVEWLQHRLLGIETIKHYGTEDRELRLFHQKTLELYEKLLRAARLKSRTGPILETISVAAMVIVLYFSLSAAISGEVSGSIQLSFFTTVAILAQSFSKLGRYYNSNREGGAAYKRVQACLNLPTVKKPGFSRTEESDIAIDLKAVDVGYDLRSAVLSGINLRFQFGKIYAVVGPSGSGKSTLVKTILGLLEPKRGAIKYAFDSSPSEAITVVPQKLKLAPMTIAENISYPTINLIDRERLKASLLAAKADFVMSFQEGVDTFVGDGGKVLSGGQIQRLFIARMLYKDRDVILIDEGTSALDPHLENVIIGLFEMLAKERHKTVIWVTHRQTGLDRCDEVIRLEKGQVVDSGKPSPHGRCK